MNEQNEKYDTFKNVKEIEESLRGHGVMGEEWTPKGNRKKYTLK